MALEEEKILNKKQKASNPHNDDGNNRDGKEWLRYGLRLGVSSALHPFEYAKVLIQLGYEPISPVPGKSILGRPVLALPNIFQYGK